ncbi:MAG: DUF1508 domain-containing protein [Hyphomonadaceae bacterium]
MHYYVYKDASPMRLWRWTLYASNGRKIANSGEGYGEAEDCLHAIDLAANSKGAPIRLSEVARALLARLRRRRG